MKGGACYCRAPKDTVDNVPFDAALESEISKLRQAMRLDGGATAGCEQLRILCPDHFTVTEQFARVADIARQENWSFAFLPDGTVRFGSYTKHLPEI